MTVGELRRLLEGVPDGDLVAGHDLDFPSIPLYVKAVRHEPQTDDGEGHATSVGGTLWIDMEE